MDGVAVVLRSLREKLGLTQADLAESVGEGLHQPTVSEIERGRARLTAAQALRMMELYRVPLSELGFRLESLLQGPRDRP